MQPMRLCIDPGIHFEDTFENSRRRKIIQMNQCDYASVQEGNLKKHLKLIKEKRSSFAKKKFPYLHI